MAHQASHPAATDAHVVLRDHLLTYSIISINIWDHHPDIFYKEGNLESCVLARCSTTQPLAPGAHFLAICWPFVLVDVLKAISRASVQLPIPDAALLLSAKCSSVLPSSRKEGRGYSPLVQESLPHMHGLSSINDSC